ncbi:MAG: hypothetical protein AAF443_00895 [Chlamydiota bacterium]
MSWEWPNSNWRRPKSADLQTDFNKQLATSHNTYQQNNQRLKDFFFLLAMNNCHQLLIPSAPNLHHFYTTSTLTQFNHGRKSFEFPAFSRRELRLEATLIKLDSIRKKA